MREDVENFKVIKLSPNGPKPGQSTRHWLYGKGKHMAGEIERIKNKKRGGR